MMIIIICRGWISNQRRYGSGVMRGKGLQGAREGSTPQITAHHLLGLGHVLWQCTELVGGHHHRRVAARLDQRHMCSSGAKRHTGNTGAQGLRSHWQQRNLERGDGHVNGQPVWCLDGHGRYCRCDFRLVPEQAVQVVFMKVVVYVWVGGLVRRIEAVQEGKGGEFKFKWGRAPDWAGGCMASAWGSQVALWRAKPTLHQLHGRPPQPPGHELLHLLRRLAPLRRR